MNHCFCGILSQEVPDFADPPELEGHRFTYAGYVQTDRESRQTGLQNSLQMSLDQCGQYQC